MEDRFLLYTYEQCAMEAIKCRSFPNEDGIMTCLETLRDLVNPAMRMCIAGVVQEGKLKAVVARPCVHGDEGCPRRKVPFVV
jgi:hypothetical protein